MRFSPGFHCLLLLFLIGSGPAFATERFYRWSDLPSADSARREGVVETIVETLPDRWEPSAGGLAPLAGERPSFLRSAQALLSLWDIAPSLAGEFPREEWTRDLLAKMQAAQIRDLSDADPADYPQALYGSILYPGWLPENQWPQSRDHYQWDEETPPLLIALYLRHSAELGPEFESTLRELISFSTDGAFRIWAAALEGASPELLEQTHTTLAYLSTLILGAQISHNAEARELGIRLFERMGSDVRRRGIHEYASPDNSAKALDLLGLLAQESDSSKVTEEATNLWLYFWTDTVLTLIPWAEDQYSMGGPSSDNRQPLNSGGEILSWLWLAGLNRQAPEIDETMALRASLDRRPPDVLFDLVSVESPRESSACFGDQPGEDRSWIRLPSLLLGVSSSSSGILDRQIAVDFLPEYSRVHLSADRGTGTGGLPEGEGTGHNPMLITAVRRGLSIGALGEIYPFDPEERVTPMLYLPVGDEDPQSSIGALGLPAADHEKEWIFTSGDWVGIPVGDWWVIASAWDLGPDNIRLRSPAEEIRDHRVLRLEIHPLYQGQAVVAGFFVSLVSREQAPAASDLEDLMAQTDLSYQMSAVGPVLQAQGGVVDGSLRAVYDVRNNVPAERDPFPQAGCDGAGPLQSPGLVWDADGLRVEGSEEDLFISLPRPRVPREAEGRAGGR